MTQNTTPAITTLDDVYATVTNNNTIENRPAFRAINAILRAVPNRPRRVAGRSYTTAREVERATKADARNYKAIIAFVKAVRAAKTEARVEAAIATLKTRTGLMDASTAPAELAAAIRNA